MSIVRAKGDSTVVQMRRFVVECDALRVVEAALGALNTLNVGLSTAR